MMPDPGFQILDAIWSMITNFVCVFFNFATSPFHYFTI